MIKKSVYFVKNNFMYKSVFNKLLKIGIIAFIAILLFISLLSLYIEKSTNKQIFTNINNIPKSYTGLVLGSKVYANGKPSLILKDRLDAGLKLYKTNKIKRFLLSGDHGTKQYDEVNTMKNYLIKHGVSESDIFLDHAGFDTYNSLIRAKKIFNVDDLIIITQKFHLKRSLFIANNLGLKANGFLADKHVYYIAKRMYFREKLANIKAALELLVNRNPKFLGHKIPITGSSKKSFD